MPTRHIPGMDFTSRDTMADMVRQARQEPASEPIYSDAEARMLMAAHTAGTSAHRDAQPNPLVRLFENADRALGYSATYNADNTVRYVTHQRAADLRRLDIRAMEVPSFANTALNHVYTPTGEQDGQRSTMDTAILAGSRAAMAGARILVIDDAPAPSASGDMLVYPRANMQYLVVSPAKFAVVADGDEVADSALSGILATSKVDLGTMPQVSFRVPLSRAERRAYENGLIEDATLVAIALGLARAADATLLGALEAADLEEFSLARAAVKSVTFGELAAITNGSAAGLAVAQDGTLRASGINAELSADATATTVGAWSRCAVAVHKDLNLLADRTSVNGDLVLTCWANMAALIPSSDFFWAVA